MFGIDGEEAAQCGRELEAEDIDTSLWQDFLDDHDLNEFAAADSEELKKHIDLAFSDYCETNQNHDPAHGIFRRYG